MNHYRLLSISTLFVTIALFSPGCKKNSVATPVTGFVYKVDGGSLITVDSATAQLYTSAFGRMIDVYAYKGGQEVLEFHFTPKVETKTVGSTFGNGAVLTYLETAINSYDSQSGSFVVSTCDTVNGKLEGDFSFIGKQAPYTSSTVRNITDGHMIVTKLIITP